MKRKCAWCNKDMGDKPPYEDDGVNHGICQECYKKYRKGHKLGCELLTACPYFNDDTYRMPGIFKEQYCRGEYRWCGRYMAFKAEERNKKEYAGAENMPTPNPYPEILLDETPGVEVPDQRHRIWDEGYEAGQHDLIEQIGRAKMMKEFPRLFEDQRK